MATPMPPPDAIDELKRRRRRSSSDRRAAMRRPGFTLPIADPARGALPKRIIVSSPTHALTLGRQEPAQAVPGELKGKPGAAHHQRPQAASKAPRGGWRGPTPRRRRVRAGDALTPISYSGGRRPSVQNRTQLKSVSHWRSPQRRAAIPKCYVFSRAGTKNDARQRQIRDRPPGPADRVQGRSGYSQSNRPMTGPQAQLIPPLR